MGKPFSSSPALAEKIYLLQEKEDPYLMQYSEHQKKRCLRDIEITLDYLQQSLQLNSPVLFYDYLHWLQVVLASRGISIENTETNIRLMIAVIQTDFPEVISGKNANFLAECIAELDSGNAGLDISYIDEKTPLGEAAKQYLNLVLNTHRKEAVGLVRKLSDEGVSVRTLYLDFFQPIQREVGRLWQLNEISVAQEHYVTAVTQLSMSQLYPQIFSTLRRGYRMVAACVGDELHEIGIRMVSDFFEMAGWDTYYLGANTPVDSIIAMINAQKADLVALSVTMSSQILKTQTLIQKIRKEVSPEVKILVGGYPFNVDQTAWQRVGADGYAMSADQAVETALNLLE